MDSAKEIKEFTRFMADYATSLLASGVHTSRVLRNSDRIASSMGLQVHMTTFQKSIIMTVADADGLNVHTEVLEIPGMPISFEYNSELSSLSWEAFDKHLSLEELRAKFEEIKSRPKMASWMLILLVGLANASFCRLFSGDLGAVIVVFVTTMLGFFLRLQMQKRGVNHFIVFTTAAFVTSLTASSAHLFDATAEIAVATSVLYLIPGVPLINGVIDILEGHTLTGVSRLIQAFLLVLCIAAGLSLSIFLFQNSLL
ncbi:MAG TPA: threonine/serine exporter family protein [Bacteroidales bacterium]|nr:threonine/serine exporter family protein [Bacteroidales bacterium]